MIISWNKPLANLEGTSQETHAQIMCDMSNPRCWIVSVFHKWHVTNFYPVWERKIWSYLCFPPHAIKTFNYAEINFVSARGLKLHSQDCMGVWVFINKCSGSGQVCSNSPFIQHLYPAKQIKILNKKVYVGQFCIYTRSELF